MLHMPYPTQIADTINNSLSVDDVLKLLGNLQQNPKSITQEQYDAVIDLLSKQDGELKEIADKLNNDKKSPLLDKVVKLSTLLSNSVNIASKVVPLVIRLLFPNYQP